MKQTTVRLKLSEVRTDPTQYKQYAPVFQPVELYLDVEMPTKMVSNDGASELHYKSEGGGTVVLEAERKILTPDGFKYLLQCLANWVSEAHDSRLKDMSDLN